jgi:uncharacterized Fe-S cluster protein YjdI
MSNKVTKAELAETRKGKSSVKEYSNGEVSVFWRADLCIHSANCLIGLPGVFNNAKRPWIDIKGASTKEIIRTVNTCPSRALTFLKNSRTKAQIRKKSSTTTPKFARIQILKDGPILITGNYIIRDANKKKIRVKTGTAALCRCGASKTKPFCDGNHLAERFLG